MSVFRLSYSLLIFLVAWLVLVHPRTSKYKYLSTPLFAFSFLAQSLIPFFVLPCLHHWYLGITQNDEQRKMKTLFRFSFLAVAPLYLFIAWVFDPPVKERQEYFTPGLSGVVRAIVILVAVSLIFVWSAIRKHKDEDQWRINVLFSLSFFALTLGAAAYIASGRLVDISEWMMNFVPRASDWESRHQLLLGLGIALFVSTLLMTIDRGIRTRVFVGLVGICVVLNLSMMQGYYFDALKQKETVSLLSNIEEISEWNSVLVADEADVYNARNRGIRSYEWEQMIIKAGGNENVAVVTSIQPCEIGQETEPAVYLLVTPSRGRLAAMVKGEVGINIRITSVSVCL
jgi:hypothetical protein